MIREDLKRALELLGDQLPGGRVVVLVRRGFGDRGVTFVRGDVEGVTGHPRTTFEAPVESWVEIVHPDDREAVLRRLKSLPDVEELRLAYRILDPSGGVRWLRESLRVQRRAPGAPPEVVGLLTDATFERTVQARVSGLEMELWRSKKLASLGTMAASVAHDFNNLLTVILAASDLLRYEPALPAGSRGEVKMIREAATRGSELVEQILAFVAHRPKGAEVLNPAEIVEGLERILDRAVGEKVELTIEADGEAWPVTVDRAHLEQILFNLASNAGEAMTSGGSLRIVVGNEVVEEPTEVERGRLRAGRYIRIVVEDTGRGMGEEIRSRLFEPFFSTKNEPDAAGSGGFGLATVLRLVRGYGGAVDVDTEPGRGSAFHVYLPVREEGRDGVAEARVRGEVDSPARGMARILVVEDDPAVRSAVKRILEGEGHTVATAGSAEEGLQIFDRVRPPFDLLVADVVLPDRSGHDLWRAATRRVKGLPVVFMSGYDRRTVAREGVTDPDSLILEKPISPSTLVEAVALALERDGGDRPDDLPDVGERGR